MATTDYIKSINGIPIVLDASSLTLNALYSGLYAFSRNELAKRYYVNEEGSLVYSSEYNFYMDFMPLLEDLHIMSNGHRVSYAILNNDGTVGTVGYNCGDTILKKSSGAMVRFSGTLADSASEYNATSEAERNAVHFCMDKGGREQLVQAFENASDTLGWVRGSINTSGANVSTSYYLRTNEVALENLVGIVTLSGVPLTINAKTDTDNLYTLSMNGVTAITKADILKIWPTATKIRIVYGDGSGTIALEEASSVYVGVRS